MLAGLCLMPCHSARSFCSVGSESGLGKGRQTGPSKPGKDLLRQGFTPWQNPPVGGPGLCVCVCLSSRLVSFVNCDTPVSREHSDVLHPSGLAILRISMAPRGGALTFHPGALLWARVEAVGGGVPSAPGGSSTECGFSS